MNWILIGLPRAGKTTLGVNLAKLIKYSFIDTDQELERKYCMSCREMMSECGEPFFRAAEKDLIFSLKPKKSIIAIGGGCLDLKALNYLKSLGKIIYLRCSEEEILRRAIKKPLPISFDLENQRESREKIFKTVADWVVDTDRLSPQKLVRFIRWQVIHLEQSLK